jgi:hypothetical protein
MARRLAWACAALCLGASGALQAGVSGDVMSGQECRGVCGGIPCLVWSPWAGLLAPPRGAYLGLGGVAQSEVAALISRVARAPGAREPGAALAGAVPADGPALKAALVFLAPELDQASLSQAAGAFGGPSAVPRLARAAQLSASSAVLPYTFSDAAPGAQSPWSAWFFAQPHAVHVDTTRSGAAAALAELDDALAAAAATAHPVVVVVSLSASPAEWDAQVAKLQAELERRVQGAFVAVFTGLNAPRGDNRVAEVDLAAAPPATQRRELAAATFYGTSVPAFLFLTAPVGTGPDTLFGFFFALFAFFILAIFLFCMDSIDTPIRFAKKYPPMGKVFE